MTGLLGSGLAGLLVGVLISIPPGPAGLILFNHALRGARGPALRALCALLLAEVLVMAVAVLSFRGLASLAAQPWMRPAAGLFLCAFALSAWRSVGSERGFSGTSPSGVFRITLINPAIWSGAVSILTLAPGDLAAHLGAKVSFVVGVEAGSLAWYLAVVLLARRVPLPWQKGLQRAAVLTIGLTGVYFAVTSLFRYIL